RVSALTVSSMDFLEKTGAWRHVSDACTFRNMEVWDAEGTARIRFEAAEVHQEQLGAIVENHHVLQAQASAIDGQGSVQCCYGDSLQALQPLDHETGHELVLESGRNIRARLVIGADGAA